MKNVSAGWKNMMLANQYLFACDLYTITLASGTVLYYTTADRNIVFGGNTYVAAALDSAPGFKRGSVRNAVGIQVNETDVTILYDASTLMQGVTPGAFAVAGGLDNALFQIDRLYCVTPWDTTNGVVNVFIGEVSNLQPDEGQVKLTISARTRRLSQPFPRNYVMTQCQHALYDSGCTLNKTSFQETLTDTGGSTTTVINSGSAKAAGYYALGYIVYTSGANNGLIRSVKIFSGGVFTLLYPLPVAPSLSDAFTAYAGCDKTQNTCNTKFSNLIHFGGFPFCPTPETMAVGQSGTPPADTKIGAGVSTVGRGPGGLPLKQQ